MQKMALGIASERSVDVILQRMVNGLVQQSGMALARVWLIEPGDQCAVCPRRLECADRSRCLHLVASAGRPSVGGQVEWNGLQGAFRRFPLGVRKIGHIGANGSGILIQDVENDGHWIVDPQWAAREQIRSFAGQPLVFRGTSLGVLGVFSRSVLTEAQFECLRLFADQAAVALANSRAFAEIERLRDQLEVENASLKQEVAGVPGFTDILGTSPALVAALQQVSLVAPTDAGVLLSGESGVGKELFAQAVHRKPLTGSVMAKA